MTRNPCVAGIFYPSGTENLRKEIGELLNSVKVSSEPSSKKIFAGVVPHAGYTYSGIAAACLYSRLKNFQRIILLGNNHSGIGPDVSIYPRGSWQTPLGEVEVDSDFSKIIAERMGISQDKSAHLQEHSIEVQVPFLQFVLDKFQIVPISLKGDITQSEKLADAIFSELKNSDKKTFVIASSDLTHYGANYGYVPFSGNNDELCKKIYELDGGAIQKIINLQSEEFSDYVLKTKATICGVNPIVAVMKYSKNFVERGKLLKYYCSGDISGDFSNCVGYASIIF